jgi:hypothetical protein
MSTCMKCWAGSVLSWQTGQVRGYAWRLQETAWPATLQLCASSSWILLLGWLQQGAFANLHDLRPVEGHIQSPSQHKGISSGFCGLRSTAVSTDQRLICCCAGMLRHQTALLDCAHRPSGAQAHYLNQFLETVKSQGITGVSNPSVCGTHIMLGHT